MLNRNTACLPLAVWLTKASAVAVPVVVANHGPALRAVQPNALSSVAVEPVAGTNQSLDPLRPLRNIVPAPKFAVYCLGVAGDAAVAVPPLVVV